jgi:predicted DNA-binding helix-hairpin-helix protein
MICRIAGKFYAYMHAKKIPHMQKKCGGRIGILENISYNHARDAT